MTEYDLILRGGLIYDGSGETPYIGDVAVIGDRIAALGELDDATGKTEIDVNGMAVAPGFINMLSWSVESLIEDGRSQSEIRQGVTLEVMGEGFSFGPFSEAMKAAGTRGILGNTDIQYEVEWTTLGEYLEFLEKRGVSPNIASFVGTSTLRIHVMGYDDREPTSEETDEMVRLLHQAMQEGAVGLSAAMIYPPASYATTEELTFLAMTVSEYGGLYISHIRSEGSTFIEALEEFVDIIESAQVRGEVYHLKAAGESNWHKMDEAIDIIEEARDSGIQITADMYTYPFSGTGLDSCIPPWAHDGGHEALIARLQDPETRARIKREMTSPSTEWENMYVENGPEKILLSGFSKEALKPLTGKTLAEVSTVRGTPPEDTLMDLLIEDDSRIFTMYFGMAEDNLRKQIVLPWVSFCSDAESQAPEGVFLKSNPHPRAYGAFARVLGKYVRDEDLLPLEEAVRRLTSFPAANLRIEKRGALQEGYFADVVVFDPAAVQDHATPTEPHQYATGMVHVFVNGTQVLKDGEHTGAKPGRVVRGPGWNKQPFEGDYPEKLHPFLTLGEDYNGTYAEFELGKAFVPDLIRMATDFRLLDLADDSRPQYYAPRHAWRRLGQLKSPEAAEPLVRTFSVLRPDVATEMPTVFGMIGAPAIPPLKKYLENFFYGPFPRTGAAISLSEIATSQPPLIYDVCEKILLDQLQEYPNQHPIFNAALCLALLRMESDAAAPLIAQVYAAKMVEESIAGKWEDMAKQLGLTTREKELLNQVVKGEIALHDHDHDHDDPDDDNPNAGFSGAGKKSSDSKKKAKRKQAAKIKKLNRKKKR